MPHVKMQDVKITDSITQSTNEGKCSIIVLFAGVCRCLSSSFVVVVCLSSFVVCNCRRAGGGPAAGCAGGQAADTPQRASSVTSR